MQCPPLDQFLEESVESYLCHTGWIPEAPAERLKRSRFRSSTLVCSPLAPSESSQKIGSKDILHSSPGWPATQPVQSPRRLPRPPGTDGSYRSTRIRPTRSSSPSPASMPFSINERTARVTGRTRPAVAAASSMNRTSLVTLLSENCGW